MKRTDKINLASKPVLIALARAITLHENGKPPVDRQSGWYDSALYEQAASLELPITA